jgi:DedD protein
MKTNRNAGWISTLVALVVLIVVGFLCGALAGFLWEEPGLVLAHLSGKTEPVQWSETDKTEDVAAPPPAHAEVAPESASKLEAADAPPAPPADIEPLGAEPESDAEVRDVVREKPAAPAPPAKPAKKPVIAPSHIAEKTPAEKPGAEKAVAEKPAPTKVASVAPAGRFSVQVGAFADRAAADKLVSRLKARGYDTFVKTDGAASGKRFRVRVGPVKERARAEALAAKLAKAENLPTWVLDEDKG